MVFTNIIKIGRVPIIPIILNIYDIRPDLAVTLLLLEPDSNLAVACLLKIGEYSEVSFIFLFHYRRCVVLWKPTTPMSCLL